MYPDIEPYRNGLLAVGDGNSVYWECCGNSNGKPALYLHGGPGSGFTSSARLFLIRPRTTSSCLTSAVAAVVSRSYANDLTCKRIRRRISFAISSSCALICRSNAGSYSALNALTSIPGVLIHGRYDVSSPLQTAWDLHKRWNASRLHVVDEAGHGGGTLPEHIVAALDQFRAPSV